MTFGEAAKEIQVVLGSQICTLVLEKYYSLYIEHKGPIIANIVDPAKEGSFETRRKQLGGRPYDFLNEKLNNHLVKLYYMNLVKELFAYGSHLGINLTNGYYMFLFS